MNHFENFGAWCQYWSKEFQIHRNSWIERTSIGMDTNSYTDQYICRISFDSIQNAQTALQDVNTYGEDYGYGHPNGCINNSNHEECWNVFMQCPDLPLVIRLANNHGGHIVWWNNQILQEPPMSIPVYIPSKSKEKKGCYVATAVYGSYDCPEVWFFRRYRDFTLNKVWYGKAFIRFYYSISPILVKYYGNSSWFVKLWRKILDKMVLILKERGIEASPYNDLY